MLFLKHLFCIFLFFILLSCKESDNAGVIKYAEVHKASIKQNLKMLEALKQEISNDIYNRNHKDNFDLKIYYTATRRYLSILESFERRIEHLKIADTLNLNSYYLEKIKDASDFTDSIKGVEQLKLLNDDRDALVIENRTYFKQSPYKDYELLRLLYLQDFKTQIINAIQIVAPRFYTTDSFSPRFYDFLIIQNSMLNDKNYVISVKANFLFKMAKDDYSITFKKLSKLNNTDTIVLNEPIVIKENNKIYKTNSISYEKGKYLLILNMNYKMPSGLIKVDEMNFEYELK